MKSTPQSIKTARKFPAYRKRISELSQSYQAVSDRPEKGGSLYHIEKITALSDLGKGLYLDPLATEAEITALALETIKA